MTENEEKVLRFLRISAVDGACPTVREICAATDIASTSTVSAVLAALEEKGLIKRDRRKSRGIVLTENSYTLVPLLGENGCEYVPFPRGGETGIFALRAEYDFDGIKAGDTVFFKECYVAAPGSAAAFETDSGIKIGTVGDTEGAVIGRIAGFSRIF